MTSTYEQRDLSRWRDTVELLARIGIRHSDVDEEMAKLEEYADAFRDKIDTHLATPMNPFGGAAREAHRTGMRTIRIETGQFELLAIEFPIQIRLERILR